MANIDRITSVQIALRSRGITSQNFSDMMLVDQHSNANRFGYITGPDELLDGWGLDTNSDLYKGAQAFFSQTPHPSRLGIGRRGSAETIDKALAEIRKVNDTWYGFSPVAHNVADIPVAAAWAEASEKLHLTAINDPDVLGAGGPALEPASQLKAGNFFRTAWWYNPDANQFPEVAAAARAFSILPGGETWHMMTLAGVTSQNLSEAEYNFVTEKNGNTFEPFRNSLSLTQNGKTAAGEWIDVIRFRDWQVEQIKVTNFQGQIDRRIPYTDKGIGLFKTWTEAALDLGYRRGGLADPMEDPLRPNKVIPSYIVTVPARATIDSNTVASRILRDVRVVARLAGAIHAVEIRGELTYDNIG